MLKKLILTNFQQVTMYVSCTSVIIKFQACKPSSEVVNKNNTTRDTSNVQGCDNEMRPLLCNATTFDIENYFAWGRI